MQGQKNTGNIVVWGLKSGTTAIRVHGGFAFLGQKWPKNTTKIGVKKKGTICPPCWAIFWALFGVFEGGDRQMR